MEYYLADSTPDGYHTFRRSVNRKDLPWLVSSSICIPACGKEQGWYTIAEAVREIEEDGNRVVFLEN